MARRRRRRRAVRYRGPDGYGPGGSPTRFDSRTEDLAGAELHNRQLFDLARSVERTALRVLEGVKPGLCAHVIEEHAPDHLIRPQSEYIGPPPTAGERRPL